VAGFVASSMQRRMANMLYPLVEDAPSHATPAHTRTVASVLRVTARAARCFSCSKCRSSCEVRRAAYRAQVAPRQEMPNLKDPLVM
jgi:heterodisulfide reductase subunit C